MNDKKYNGRVTVMTLSTTKVSRRRERALMRFEGKLAGMEQVTEAGTCIEREYYIDQGLTMWYKYRGRRSGKQG